ncbi:unnamed protein product [Owenia fusiformis]|uniref:Galactosylceramide sulfotransferase n=1 Tax=Owenia fusiformis TaxID=6347 RepID=A0A8S4N1M7_OWEFU|nr:unnamed protein product [Owenia fusiformis]
MYVTRMLKQSSYISVPVTIWIFLILYKFHGRHVTQLSAETTQHRDSKLLSDKIWRKTSLKKTPLGIRKPNTRERSIELKNIDNDKSSKQYPTLNVEGHGRVQKDDPRLNVQLKQPVQNVFFLKTHKTASSTVQNIFMRYGDNRNLTFGLAKSGNLLGYPLNFKKDVLSPLTIGNEYNIICHHLRYNRNIKQIMPENTKFISIVRNPFHQFRSAFYYYLFQSPMCYNIASNYSLKTFTEATRRLKERICGVPTRNIMMYDFGMDFPDMNDEALIQQKIQMIDEDFDLILITDYLDESLILMKELLNWKIDDIVSFTKTYSAYNKSNIITQSMATSMVRWNYADHLLFKHFNDSLWEKIDVYGRDRMNKQISVLRNRRHQLESFCIKNMSFIDEIENIDFKPTNRMDITLGYNLNVFAKGNRTCNQLATDEVPYTKKLGAKMKKLGRFSHRLGIRNTDDFHLNPKR